MTRQTLYRLIDTLPEEELLAAARYLQFLSLSHNADQVDDEPFSYEERAALQESWAQLERGEVIAFEDVIQSLDPGFSFDS